jgi:DNA-binding YbaB/EbfC family protein
MSGNPFGKIPGGMSGLFKQAQKAMEEAKNVETELEQTRVEGQAGGGKVKVAASGKGDILEIKISKDVVDPDDVEMLEDLVTLAVREAVDKANHMREERLRNILPGGGLGGGLGGMLGG